MVETFNIKLGKRWSVDVEFVSLSTLEDVHNAIQQAVDFDNDHLYAFYIARTELSRKKTMFDDENGRIFSTKICDLFPLPPKERLFYLFDYGDNWLFTITKTRKKQHQPVDGVDYPRVVKESGEKPVQYDYDEDDDDDFWIGTAT